MLVDRMIDEATGWDHLDELAIHVLGPLIQMNLLPLTYLGTCSKAENFWKRRAALIAQITFLRRGKGHIALHLELCRAHLYEKEFFIRKAIGWSLRELAKSNPEGVSEFLQQNKDQISNLTMREASKNLPDYLKAQIKLPDKGARKSNT
jgi:3-methyladenine DNA glycosylase AlkD